MDFFDHQEQAKRKTSWLVALFALSVIAIIVAVYVASRLLLFGAGSEVGLGDRVPLWDPVVFLAVTAVTLLVVGSGTLYKVVSLREGGPAVARLLGGEALDPNTTDLAQRRLFNVVEEMAIAAGIPVPTVYLLAKEPGINAFAAGHGPEDAVIGITDGALRHLSRDELQGVIGHELSHVLNGDMRLNLRLIGLLHGILVIALIGEVILRGTRFTAGSSRKKGSGGAILLFGLVLFLLGWIGVFFGRLIKAGVSRQREFLADAASVQFTRNPEGLAGALKKIGGLSQGSQLKSPQAEQASHLFFSNGIKQRLFTGLLATHPPLAERIRRIDPSFDGEFPKVEGSVAAAAAAPAGSMAAFAGPADYSGGPPGAAAGPASGRALAGTSGGGTAGVGPAPAPPALPPAHSLPATPAAASAAAEGSVSAGAPASGPPAQPGVTGSPPPDLPPLPADPAATAARAGTLGGTELAGATAILARLPAAMRQASREPVGAQALIYGLLLDRDQEIRTAQLEAIQTAAPEEVLERLIRLPAALDSLAPEARLPLADLTVPALRRLGRAHFDAFEEIVERLIAADETRSIFEYTLQWVLRRRVRAHFESAPPPVVQYYALRGLAAECELLLSTLAHAGHEGSEAASAAFAHGLAELGEEISDRALLPPERCDLERLDRVLETLALASPAIKRRLIQAATAAIADDGRIEVDEAELLRVVCEALQVPMPPFIAPGPAPEASAA